MDSPLNDTMIPPLLKRFYDRVRQDPLLGPVFDAAVAEWPIHLGKLADFWSSVMLTSGRYKGSPVKRHLEHGDVITADMFERWLALWGQTTEEMLPPDAAVAMQDKANRIAESLQLSLSLATAEGRAEMMAARPSSKPYSASPVFNSDSLPAALRRAHSTKAGVWG